MERCATTHMCGFSSHYIVIIIDLPHTARKAHQQWLQCVDVLPKDVHCWFVEGFAGDSEVDDASFVPVAEQVEDNFGDDFIDEETRVGCHFG